MKNDQIQWKKIEFESKKTRNGAVVKVTDLTAQKQV